ncbi:hypothetical protein [Pantoea sp. JZ2]|uniref:hypothetical protein n=1 Tax=Pantoea sp. JZ2 TaxID=2654189 RepID=UPI002B4818C3|nr:hypothetical protein [Pantoea sp. JZ2]
MALTDRDTSILKAVSEAVREVMAEANAKHAAELQERDMRIEKLESDVSGLISLLGEH